MEKKEKAKERITECNEKKLTKLNLSDCGLTQIPKELLKLTQLMELNLARNKLSNFNGLDKLKNLTNLDLDSCNLTKIPEEVFELTNLTTLYLNTNDIQSIPQKISRLKKLTSLLLRSNKFIQFPLKITTLRNLQKLWLGNNLLKSLTKDISHLNNLISLELYNCNLSSFPTEILSLKNLSYLDLSNYDFGNSDYINSIHALPSEITWLEKLENLFLNNNQIKKLSKELPQLKILSLEGNPVAIPPPEIAIEKDYEDKNSGGNIKRIKNYFKELEEKQVDYLYEVKLLIVGEEKAGKSSLAEALSNPRYRFKDKQSTEGIDILKWIIPNEELNLTRDVRLNIWDFGGQEIYHATHQFFLTKRSIYFLVTEARKDPRHDDFYYWLNLIEKLGDKSPVTILLNKCDEPNTGLAIREYKETFDNIVDSLKVSCKDEYRDTIKNLKVATLRIVKNKELLPDIGTPLPKVWIDIRYELERKAEAGNNYISYEEYLSICNKHGMSEGRALFLSDFFHRIGVFLHFRNNLFLEKTIFLNHEWVTEGVYNVLDNQEIIDRYGRFNESDLKKIWKDPKYKDKRSELLMLMQNFEICFILGNGNYLAPQLLPTDKPDEIYGFDNPNNLKNPLHFEYRYTFMPKGILTRFIVKRNKDIYKNTYWKFGVLLEFSKTKALVRERYFDYPKRITIILEGRNKKILLAIIRKTMREIHKDYQNLQYKEMIPCNCMECRKSGAPYYYDLAELEKRLQKNKATIECYRSYEDIDIKTLVKDVITSRDVIVSKKEMIQTRERNKIFISYSHKDKMWLEKIRTHLKLLENEGIPIDVWDDTQIKAGTKWDKEINKALKSTKIALILITTDFLASDFITKVELPSLLKAAEDDGAVIIPVIIKPSRFLRQKNLSQFQAINNPDKPLIELSEGEQDRILVDITDTIEEYLMKE